MTAESARIDYVTVFPAGVRAMVGLQRAVDAAGIEPLLLELVKMRASQINGCAYCLDMHSKDARALGESEQRLHLLAAWREAPCYDARERAALAWCEEVTLISQAGTPDAVYDDVERAFSANEIVALTLAIVAINGWNRLAISMRAPVGEYVSPRRPTSNASAARERIRHPNTTNRESTMPIALREAEIVWDGPLASGAGSLTSGSGALSELPVTWASRTERADGKTSPEELIAAAHSSCFAMALSLVLGENRTPPDRVTVNAACTLDEVEGAPRITTVELTVRAQVPGIEAAELERMVERAADLCPVSNALRGNVEITVRS